MAMTPEEREARRRQIEREREILNQRRMARQGMTPAERADRELSIAKERSLLSDRAERRRRAGLNTSEKSVAGVAAPGTAVTPTARPATGRSGMVPDASPVGMSYVKDKSPVGMSYIPDASPAGVSYLKDKSPAGTSYVADTSPAGMSYPASASPVGKPQRGMGARSGMGAGWPTQGDKQVPDIARPGVSSRYAPKGKGQERPGAYGRWRA